MYVWGGTDKGKVINGGFYTSQDEIPQLFSLITGANMWRPDEEKPAAPDKSQDADVKPAAADAEGLGRRRPDRRRRRS
jgi:hypothetical protein